MIFGIKSIMLWKKIIVCLFKKKKKSLKNKLKSYNDVATDFHDVEMPNLL